MKTIQTITVIISLALVANIGFAQKNILIHKNHGLDLKMNAEGVDSITFTDHATPGTDAFNTYNALDSMELEHHAKVTWQATYKGDCGIIPGGFNELHCDMLFDEANPALMKFDGSVTLSSTNTFEPGRDNITHCVNGSMGVSWTTVDSILCSGDTMEVHTYVDDVTNYATLSAGVGDIVAYGDGYKATADFTFQGTTASVDVYFVYLGIGVVTPYYIIEAEFQFDSADYAMGSSPQGYVYVRMHMKFHHL